jgi:hypothetical protein
MFAYYWNGVGEINLFSYSRKNRPKIFAFCTFAFFGEAEGQYAFMGCEIFVFKVGVDFFFDLKCLEIIQRCWLRGNFWILAVFFKKFFWSLAASKFR